MKYIIVILILVLFIGCKHKVYTDKNGKYILQDECISGHNEEYTTYYYINNVCYPLMSTMYVCDEKIVIKKYIK